MHRRRDNASRPSSCGRGSASIMRGCTAQETNAPRGEKFAVPGLYEWSFAVPFWVVGAFDRGLTRWRSNLPAKEITSRHRIESRSLLRFATRVKPRTASCLTRYSGELYGIIGHSTIPRRYRNYTDRLLENFVACCDQCVSLSRISLSNAEGDLARISVSGAEKRYDRGEKE
jgi:hypothetical protein